MGMRDVLRDSAETFRELPGLVQWAIIGIVVATLPFTITIGITIGSAIAITIGTGMLLYLLATVVLPKIL